MTRLPRTTARFWEFINGSPVKIKLRPGRQFAHVAGGLTDEGFSYTANTWSFDGQFVEVYTVTNARDCDGPISSESGARCPQILLASGYRDEDYAGVVYPDWQARSLSQRDTYAEAMGY